MSKQNDYTIDEFIQYALNETNKKRKLEGINYLRVLIKKLTFYYAFSDLQQDHNTNVHQILTNKRSLISSDLSPATKISPPAERVNSPASKTLPQSNEETESLSSYSTLELVKCNSLEECVLNKYEVFNEERYQNDFKVLCQQLKLFDIHCLDNNILEHQKCFYLFIFFIVIEKELMSLRDIFVTKNVSELYTDFNLTLANEKANYLLKLIRSKFNKIQFNNLIHSIGNITENKRRFNFFHKALEYFQ